MKSFLKMFLSTLLFSAAFISNIETFAGYQPDTMWTKTFGGSNIDVGYSVQQTSDGGYIITGYTRSFGTISGRNIWLLKTDVTGTEEWNNTYGGNSDEEAYSVQQTTDGGYILTGYTKSFGAGLNDVILVKTDSLGNELWKKTFGGTSDDEGFSVQQTKDGGFIIAGVTSSFGAGSRDAWLIKTNASGNEIWRKTLGGLSSDGARSVQQTSDGGYVITGWTFSSGPGIIGNVLLLKTDSLGIMEWSKAFGGDDVDRGYCVQQTSDDGFILSGYTSSFGAGNDDMLLIKTDRLGTETWSKTFGGSGRDYGNSVQQTSDGGFIITGYTLSFGAGGDDIWLVKTNSSGIEEWNKTFGGLYSDQGNCVKETSDGGYVITGHTLSYGAGVHDVWLIKTTPIIPVELTSFSADVFEDDVSLSWTTATETNNKGFEIERSSDLYNNWKSAAFIEGMGTSTETHQYSFVDKNILPGIYYYRLKQVDFDGGFEYSQVVSATVNLPGEFSLKQNYPNPFNPSTRIEYSVPKTSQVTIKIFDILGNLIDTPLDEEKPAGTHEIIWNAENFPGGVYLYRIYSDSYRKTMKMILLK